MTGELSEAGGYNHDHDEELGEYWYGVPKPPSKRRTAQPGPKKPEPAPQVQSESQEVNELIDELRRWQRPDYIGVSRFRGRDDGYWKETRNLVLDYLALQVKEEDFELYRFAFIAWLRASPNFLQAYKDGDDMARATLVDWFVKRAV